MNCDLKDVLLVLLTGQDYLSKAPSGLCEAFRYFSGIVPVVLYFSVLDSFPLAQQTWPQRFQEPFWSPVSDAERLA